MRKQKSKELLRVFVYLSVTRGKKGGEEGKGGGRCLVYSFLSIVNTIMAICGEKGGKGRKRGGVCSDDAH